MVLPDRSPTGPECRSDDWNHLFKGLLASSIAEAGPGPRGSSSSSPSNPIPSIQVLLSLSQSTIISQTLKVMKNFIECFLGINM